MKKIMIFVMLFLCLSAFSQENAAPAAGSVGLSARMEVISGILPGVDMQIGNPTYWSIGLGLGIYYWISTEGNLSMYVGIQALSHLAVDNPSEEFSGYMIEALQFGMQYNFNKNIAIFCNFGLGAQFSFSGDGAWVQIMPPQLGISFYF